MDFIDPLSIWDAVIAFLSTKLKKEDVDLWFTDVKLISLENNILKISVPNKFFQEWIETNCSLLFQNYFYSNFGIDIKIKYEINTKKLEDVLSLEYENFSEKNYKKYKKKPAFSFNDQYTFQSFVIGKMNNFAYAVSEAVAKDPGNCYNPLFI